VVRAVIEGIGRQVDFVLSCQLSVVSGQLQKGLPAPVGGFFGGPLRRCVGAARIEMGALGVFWGAWILIGWVRLERSHNVKIPEYENVYCLKKCYRAHERLMWAVEATRAADFSRFFSRGGGTICAAGAIDSTGTILRRVKARLKAKILGARLRPVRRFSLQLRMIGLSLIFARSWKGRANRPDDDRFSHARKE
jgi:hypothetical protein